MHGATRGHGGGLGAAACARATVACVCGLGEASVGEHGVQIGLQEDVGRLEVAMHAAEAVEVEERFRRLQDDPQPLAPRERLWRRGEVA